MTRHTIAACLVSGAVFTASPALACAVHEPLNLRSALGADLVVTGRIVDHRVGPRGDGRFDVAVAEVLRGRAGRRVTVRFSGSLPGLPRTLPRGPVLIALRAEGGAYGVLYHICSDPFLLEARSPQAVATRRLLAGRRGGR